MLSKGMPHIAIPITAETSSKVTSIAILAVPREQTKKSIVSDFLLPNLVIVAPKMTVSCPANTTAASGVGVLMHCTEAYPSNFFNPIITLLPVPL